uniref:NADH dehydrogenase subunit 2 n=1 Tax=Fascioloides magna TaxID=394415 RepID=A0A109WVL0_9TREM|nr:NADH dehydrogenase subunit 2 [Fascioloides magna]AMF83646.1 NADH dehydrogenase subunit 2 [Fascioloides magna]
MRGIVIGGFSVVGLMGFSLLIFSSANLSFFWLFLELVTLSTVPLFFLGGGLGCLSGLFNYIVISGISSSLILCGVLSSDLLFVLVLGLLFKFGLFPLWGWVYGVSLSSNWLVVWSLSTFLKAPVFFLPLFLASGGYSLVNVLCCLSFLSLSILFWVYSFGWFHCWCHMMLSSSAALVAMCLVLSSDVLLFIFLVYCVWGSFVILFFSSCGEGGGVFGLWGYYFFCFLLLSIPVSFSIFYKLVMVSGMFSCWFVVLVSWVIYSVSEQVYLLKFVMSFDLPKGVYGVFSVV